MSDKDGVSGAWLDLGEYHGPGRAHAFVRFMIERRKKRDVEQAFRVYVTDSLQAAPQGKYLTKRYEDLLTPHEIIDVEKVIQHVAEVGGLEVI